jgi:predicted nucleic acid-binding Zn ribbon protein
MPTYVWECSNPKCGEVIEKYYQRFIRDNEKKIKCPKCKKIASLRTFAPLGIKFCEKGHYIQDRKFSNDNPDYNFALKKELEKKKKKRGSKC